MAEQSKPHIVVEAVSDLVKAVPIYQDTLQPAAKELGKALQTVAKSIHLALAPVAALVWGYEQIQQYLSETLARRLMHVPTERIITPSPVIAGPILEALRFVGTVEELRDLYANLLASSMDRSTASNTHPSFVEVIKNLSPDDARIIRLFASRLHYPVIDIRARTPVDRTGRYHYRLVVVNHSSLGELAKCERDATGTYLDNLCRLGLLHIQEDELTAKAYDGIVDEKELEELRKEIEAEKDWEMQIVRKGVRITNFGINFLQSCLPPHDRLNG